MTVTAVPAPVARERSPTASLWRQARAQLALTRIAAHVCAEAEAEYVHAPVGKCTQ
jgi:hypothetical protein